VYPRYPFASNLAFRREGFLSVGGFPVDLGPRGDRRISNEEDALFRRVQQRGWSVVYEPRALVYHWVHDQRVSRRYLLRRSLLHGQSDVVVDAMFVGRSRVDRARRAIEELAEALDAGRLAVTRRHEGTSMRALVAAGMDLGRATQDAKLSVSRRRPLPAALCSTSGLTLEQRNHFDRDGFVRIPNAFGSADAMVDRIWEFLARRGIARDDPATWPSGKAHHLQKLLREGVFMPIGGPTTSAAIDDILGADRWERPDHWGEFLVNFPEPGRTWIVPTLWHTDAPYTDPLTPPAGVMVLSFLNHVELRGGATLVVAGSHRLVARFFAQQPQLAEQTTAVARKAFYQSHPWLTDLVSDADDPTRSERFAAEVDIDGLPARLVELTGAPGDVIITHPLIAHCVSPNCARQPRLMRIARPRLRVMSRSAMESVVPS
jgi:hypothetical protein